MNWVSRPVPKFLFSKSNNLSIQDIVLFEMEPRQSSLLAFLRSPHSFPLAWPAMHTNTYIGCHTIICGAVAIFRYDFKAGEWILLILALLHHCLMCGFWSFQLMACPIYGDQCKMKMAGLPLLTWPMLHSLLSRICCMVLLCRQCGIVPSALSNAACCFGQPSTWRLGALF